MNRDATLRDAFATALGIDAEKVTDELTYNSIPEWDSVAHMALIAELEKAFGIMLDTDDVIDLSSMAKAREIVAKYETAS